MNSAAKLCFDSGRGALVDQYQVGNEMLWACFPRSSGHPSHWLLLEVDGVLQCQQKISKKKNRTKTNQRWAIENFNLQVGYVIPDFCGRKGSTCWFGWACRGRRRHAALLHVQFGGTMTEDTHTAFRTVCFSIETVLPDHTFRYMQARCLCQGTLGVLSTLPCSKTYPCMAATWVLSHRLICFVCLLYAMMHLSKSAKR